MTHALRDRAIVARTGNSQPAPYVQLNVVGRVRTDATGLARRARALLATVTSAALILIGVLAAMLPGPILAGDTATVVALTLPLLASLTAAAFAMTALVRLLLPAPVRASRAPDRREDLLAHWLQAIPPHCPEQPRAPGRR